MFQTIAEMFTR